MLTRAAAFVALTLGFCYQGLKLIHYIIRQQKIRKQTGVVDLQLSWKPRKDGDKIRGTAVICGGSIAGLASARVCHDHFERVVIVEPEDWLSTEDAWTENVLELQRKRSRLMQWDSYQGTQVWATSCLSKLFPDFACECAASDIPLIPALTKFHFSGKPVKQPLRNYNGQIPRVFCAGRPGFETLLRRLVIGRKHYPNIEQIHGTIIGYEKDPENPTCLRGVLVRQPNNEVVTISATLILDCTGPARVGTKLIRRLGFGLAGDCKTKERPLDELTLRYDQNVFYSTLSIPLTDDQISRFPEEARMAGPISVFFPDAKSGERRALLAQRIDRNIMQVCCGQWGGDSGLPTNLTDYKTYARSLNYEIPVPEFWYRFLDVLRETEDKATVKAARIAPSVYTPFHRAANMPSNWIAVGDSIMHINPIFGQGISKALLGVVSLNTLLHRVHSDDLPKDFAKKFFHMQADKIEPIWAGVKNVDYDYDTTVPLFGETLSTALWIRWYVRQLLILATKDEHIGSMMWRVRSFLAPPFDILHPDAILKVLWEVTKSRIVAK